MNKYCFRFLQWLISSRCFPLTQLPVTFASYRLNSHETMSEVEFRALNYVTPLDTDLPSNLPNRTLYNPPHVSDIDPLPIFQIVRDGTHPRRGGYCGKPTCAARRTLWQACAPHRGHCGKPVRRTADIAVCRAADIVASLCAAPRTLRQACAPHKNKKTSLPE